MDTVQIVSWLLTRSCNLKCDYCRIVRNYNNKPDVYPNMNHYLKNQMSTEDVIETLGKFKLHNPNSFHILYGGEPLLRRDLAEIINYCNKENINYTIITNNSDSIQLFIDELFEKVEYVTGLTSSVDPIIFRQGESSDRMKKSLAGFKRLMKYRGKVKDLVAEITVDRDSVDDLLQLVKELTKEGISSDITFIDIAKNHYYDFAEVTDRKVLVDKDPKIMEIFNTMIKYDLNVHMKETLLPMIYETLPSDMDCGIEKDVHNITIDADGTIRLCLRIRGLQTPSNFNIHNFMDVNGKLNPDLKPMLWRDKTLYCEKCNWTCMIMSQIVSEMEGEVSKLIHKDVRG
jgi:MoaA/NifB/PqqE/SkfB family radical SAM enzyme